MTQMPNRYRIAAPVLAALVLAPCGCDRAGEATTASEQQTLAAPRNPAPANSLGPTEVPVERLRTVPAAAPAPEPVSVAFDPPVLDFGFVKPGKSSEGTVVVRNLGDKPLRIRAVRPTCKCTTLNDLTGTVIPPGGSVDLEAELEGRSMTGVRTADIKFTFDGSDQVYVVSLKAEVTRPIRANPSIFNMGAGETTGHVVVESVGGEPFTILAANREPPSYVGYDPEFDEPRNSYVLEWDLTEEAQNGTLPAWWVIETDHPECPLLDTWVRHLSTIQRPPRDRGWRVADLRLLVGGLEPGEAWEDTVVVKDIASDSIYSVRSLSNEFNAELVEYTTKRNDGECLVRITPQPGVTGLFMGRIEFIASTHTQQIEVIGKVMP